MLERLVSQVCSILKEPIQYLLKFVFAKHRHVEILHMKQLVLYISAQLFKLHLYQLKIVYKIRKTKLQYNLVVFTNKTSFLSYC